ncbi:hypothetical protein [Cupriavidus basilensis]|uniref:Nmad2 family putative nucleotide modification protein n=1 Tax=Cupriavidus basilensis TaxID=68895 RepID=UPI0023E87A20|nr:hypothetical protein [Cupriavidus basilensis]MDF3883641.1 hypothetical protein [Cupriavidus basilensis]
MELFSYVVARDYGFAPNPFDGHCTLATCKPDIRQRANVGDWLAGIASANDSRIPRLVYAMRVDEVLTYDSYWRQPRFHYKRPLRTGSVKQLFGDNIYHRNGNGEWIQADSHHSHHDGSPNQRNIINDTQSHGVLVSEHFAYWGSKAVEIPQRFLDFDGETLLIGRGYRRHFSAAFINEFVQWFEGLQMMGFLGAPYQWERRSARWSRPQ